MDIMKTWLFILLIAFLGASLSAAAKIGQELHIFANGDIHLVAAEVVSKHALNLISVEVWAQKWTIPLDQYTKLESAYGAPLKLEEILNGHKLEIKGRPMSNKSGWLDARLVRDMDVKTGQMPQIPSGPTPSVILPSAPAPTTPSAPLISSAKRQLTQYLTMGMRGGEVIILQEFLQKNNWGIPDDGPVTGFFGKVTQAAVRKFQEASELPPEGVVGPKTRALINALLK